MRFQKVFSLAALAAGMAVAGSTALMAQDRGDIYHDRRDLRHDYANADRLRDDMGRDRVRLNQDMRYGRGYAAAAQARDIARDQCRLDSQVRDIRHDRRDVRNDYRGY